MQITFRKNKLLKYSIFHHIVESDLPLPELQENNNAHPTLFFKSATISEVPKVAIDWCHHWRLPDGQISISVGKEKKNYWLRFPQLIDFKLQPHSNQITAYRHKNIPDNTVCHLLLDQVIPRLLSHQGQLIIHASCIQIGDSVIAFCGESGWGKSTLAAYFYTQGYKLITDDCLLLETKDATMTGIPNYLGLRLLSDSLSLLPESRTETTEVCHYASKKRVTVSGNNQIQAIPISAIFFLNEPYQQDTHSSIAVQHIPGATALIELIKHCFPLDITDVKRTGTQLTSLAELIKNSKTRFYHLEYPRTMESLPNVLKTIIKASTPQSHVIIP